MNFNKVIIIFVLIIMTPFLFVQTTKAEYRTAEDMNKIAMDRYSIADPQEYIGEFTITYYCNCSICCGKWSYGVCKDGSIPKDNYTIAVDKNVIPLGTFLKIGDLPYTYKACDTGSAIIGNKIDIYCSNHEKCLKLGRIKNVKVYKIA